ARRAAGGRTPYRTRTRLVRPRAARIPGVSLWRSRCRHVLSLVLGVGPLVVRPSGSGGGGRRGRLEARGSNRSSANDRHCADLDVRSALLRAKRAGDGARGAAPRQPGDGARPSFVARGGNGLRWVDASGGRRGGAGPRADTRRTPGGENRRTVPAPGATLPAGACRR